MKKRLLSVLLIGAMTASLAACGSSSSSSSSGSSSTEATAETEAPTQEAVDAAVEAAAEAVADADVIEGVEELNLTLSHHCTEDDSNHVFALAFADAVEQLSGGAMTVDVYANGQLFGQNDALAALSQGTLDIALSDTALFANYDPAGALFDMPYLVNTREQAIEMTGDEVVLEFIREKMTAGAGFYVLNIQPLYFRSSLVKDMEIDSIEDFKGVIMRTPEAPHTIAAFEAFGANPTVIPSGEAYTAVQTGVADGLEGHPEYMVLQKFYEVAQNYVQTKHVFTFTAYSMSQQVYDSLSDAQREVIDEAVLVARQAFLDYTADLFPNSEAKLKELGVQFTEVDLTPFQEACAPYVENYIAENNLEELYERIQSME